MVPTLNCHGDKEILVDSRSVVLQTPLGRAIQLEFMGVSLLTAICTHRKWPKMTSEMMSATRDMLNPTVSSTRVFSAISIFIYKGDPSVYNRTEDKSQFYCPPTCPSLLFSLFISSAISGLRHSVKLVQPTELVELAVGFPSH